MSARVLGKEAKAKIGLTCAHCGATTNLEYHHIIPVACGGSNELSNYVCLCSFCHKEYHKKGNYSNSELTKMGLQKRKSYVLKDHLVSKAGILRKIFDEADDTGIHLSALEIVDIIINCPPSKQIYESKDTDIQPCLEDFIL